MVPFKVRIEFFLNNKNTPFAIRTLFNAPRGKKKVTQHLLVFCEIKKKTKTERRWKIMETEKETFFMSKRLLPYGIDLFLCLMERNVCNTEGKETHIFCLRGRDREQAKWR